MLAYLHFKQEQQKKGFEKILISHLGFLTELEVVNHYMMYRFGEVDKEGLDILLKGYKMVNPELLTKLSNMSDRYEQFIKENINDDKTEV